MKNLVVYGIVAACIGLMIFFPHIMLNPGELVQGHQKMNQECTACHEPFSGISNEKCISCHKLSEIGKDTAGRKSNILFHSKLGNQECVSCHTDHKGMIPSESISKFDHEILSATEQTNCTGCHAKPEDKLHQQVSLACSNCHSTEGWKLSATFDHSMIQSAVKNNCLSCHQKPSDSYHSSFKDNCGLCHGTDKWAPSTFDHSGYFQLDQNHNSKCITCHTNNVFTSYTCYGCHEHSESKIRDEHNEEGIYDFSNCVSCHKSGNEHDIRRDGKSGNPLNQQEVKDVNNYIQQQDKEKGQKNDDDDD